MQSIQMRPTTVAYLLMFGSPPAAARDADPEAGGDRLAQRAERATEGTCQPDPAPGLCAGCKWGAGVWVIAGSRKCSCAPLPQSPELGPRVGRQVEAAGSLLNHWQLASESAEFERDPGLLCAPRTKGVRLAPAWRPSIFCRS